MSIVSSTESRTDQRNVYMPPPADGMAHRSYLSPDGKQVLVVEMDVNVVAALPVGALRRQLSRKARRPGAGAVHGRRLVPRWQVDVFLRQYRQRVHIWRQRFPDGTPEQVTFGASTEEGDSFRARRPLLRHVDRHQPEHGVGPRFARRSADHFGRLRFLAVPLPRWQEAVLPGALGRRCGTWNQGGFWVADLDRAAPAAAARFSDAALHHLRLTASAWCSCRWTNTGRTPVWLASSERADAAAAAHHDRRGGRHSSARREK